MPVHSLPQVPGRPGLPRLLRVFRYAHRFREVMNAFRVCRNPFRLLAAYFGLPGVRYPQRLRFRPDLEFEVRDLYEAVTAWVIFCRQEYYVPAEAATILDVGANLGMFSLYAATRAPRARVVALEPYPRTFSRLVENVEKHGLGGRIVCWNLGVAGQTGYVNLEEPLTMKYPHSAVGLPPAGNAASPTSRRVEVSSWADLMRRLEAEMQFASLDLVKMDIEGHEYEVLAAAERADLERVAMWVMEVHNNKPRQLAYEVLQGAGLTLVRDVDDPRQSGSAWLRRLPGTEPTAASRSVEETSR